MNIRRYFMEDWLASNKDSCPYNLGESGMPDIRVGELLERCGESPDSLASLILKDHDTRGTERLRHAILSTCVNDDDVEFGNITATTGTSEALFILFNLLMDGRSSVVAPRPSFQALYDVPRALGADVRFYRLDDENGFRPDPDEVCGLIDDTTGVVVINSPHNPSGVIIPCDTAESIIRKAAIHGATVLSDEHYRFLPFEGGWPLRTLARPEENVVATGSITKCFGVNGLRIGWIIAPESLIGRIRDFRDYLTHTLSPLSDYCAALALEHASAFINPALHVLRENASLLSNMTMRTPGLSLVMPEGGIVAFPRFEYPVSSDDFVQRLIGRYGVFVLPGSSFEAENHVRINLGQDPALFREALSRIHDFCIGQES
ncbi:aminotransferase class I/II-fold pyridoxal phosphate-dependent enzyme [bacterium]|nr:aminotransferase class I/II-fold pyridoxal phosphate-dependent enzyme [bacterium]